MADIFGKRDYAHYGDLRKKGFSPDEYIQDNWKTVPVTQGKSHDFTALETRAIQGAEPLGFVMDNFVAIQAVIEEVERNRARLDRFVPFVQDISEGAQTYGYRVLDYKGDADFLDNFGTDSPSVSTEQSLVAYPLRPAGNVAQYSDEELRAAMFDGVPLETATIEAAVGRCMRHMERVGFTGSGNYKGLINQETRAPSGTDLEKVVVTTAGSTIANGSAEATAKLIADAIGDLVERSNELIGETFTGEVVVGLPVAQYNLVKSTTMNNKGSDLSIAEHVMRHNGWTDEGMGNSISFQRLQELKGAGASNQDRMLILLKNSRILEFAVPIMPRVKEAIRMDFGVRVPIEYKISPGIFIKRPFGITYVDNV